MYTYFRDNGDNVEFGTYEIVNCESTPTVHHVLKHEQLARCPFRGGAAEVKGMSVYYNTDGMRIRCKDCGSTSRSTLYGSEPLRPFGENPSPEPLTPAEALQRAVAAWNRRAV